MNTSPGLRVALLTLALLGSGCPPEEARPVETGGSNQGGGAVSDDTDTAPEEQGCETITVYADGDGDGYGDDSTAEIGCEGEVQGVTAGGDCDDQDAAVSPGTPEICDGLDQDCDGEADDGLYVFTGYQDADGDGFGDDATARSGCALEQGEITVGGDCDDAAPEIYPGAPELAVDGVDQDCDGADSGHSVLVVERYDGELAQLSASDGAETARLGGLGALVGVARADDGTIYVSQLDGDTISAVAPDLSASEIALSTAVGGPRTLAWDPSTSTLLIAGYDAGKVQELDPATGVSRIVTEVVSAPVGVFRFPDDDVIYLSTGDARALLAVSASTGALLASLDLPAAADSLSPDGPDALWVSSGDGDAVYHVDLTVPEVSTVKTGLTAAYGSCVHPDGETLLVSEEGAGVIIALSRGGAATLFSTAMSRPWQCATDVAFDADHDGLYSAAHGGTDCDDFDADAGACPGGARWPTGL